MCGVIGYVGEEIQPEFFFNGLKSLEYRGYDSAGIAMHGSNGIEVVRASGKLSELLPKLKELPASSKAGIGHTRWATHGEPVERNAHPHSSGPIVLLHNGIIENYLPLKLKLQREGYEFLSDTDTEVAAHLLHNEYKQRADLEPVERMKESLFEVVRQIHGAYAFAILCSDTPDYLFAAKQGSPMVLGRSASGNYLASGVAALVSHTQEVARLEDGDIAILSREGIAIVNASGKPQERPFFTVSVTPAMLEKEGFEHFMQKEMWQHPQALRAVIEGRLSRTGVSLEAIGLSALAGKVINRIQCVACGSSHFVCMVGKYLIEELCGIPVDVDLASEFRYKARTLQPGTLAVAISQSGETIDTLLAMRAAKEQGAFTLGIINAEESTIAHDADSSLYLRAGIEVGVASTKAISAQITALLMVGLGVGTHLVSKEKAVSTESQERIIEWLLKTPSLMEEVLEGSDHIEQIAKELSDARGFLFMGRGVQWPVAEEGALKLKELAYVFADAHAGGELKHGPIALIDDSIWVVALAPRDRHYEKMVSNIAEIKARGGKVLAVGTAGDSELQGLSDAFIGVPASAPEIMPLLTIIPLHLLAYWVARQKGNDIDQPRNLAKSVTVE
jgi:glutamine---fructose-6-phosphate transaminase (isomerizing)